MENAAMSDFFDGEIESLCSIFTLEQPNFGDEFLSHSIHSFIDNINYLPPSNLNHFSFHHDNISNTDISDNASDSTSYNHPSQTTNDSSQNSHYDPINISMMAQENCSLFGPEFLTALYVDGLQSSQEDNESNNLGLPPNRKRTCNTQEERDEGEGPKKRARVLKDRGNKKCIGTKNDAGKEETSDDDESKVYEQASEGENSALKETSKGSKKRASRGAATDPQSLYARRRRERINERLRILQSLVPNGTKVDISTMLEEALHYVKFLQLQIRLLSSDELWMYAPIAYNGVDISLYKRISPFLLP